MKALDKIYLSFQIDKDIFAVDALKVDHILELPSHITKVPNTPEYMKGIIILLLTSITPNISFCVAITIGFL